MTIEQDRPSVHMTSALGPSDAEDTACNSRFQFGQLVEMGVVVSDVETVDPGARKDEQVGKQDGHA